MKSFLKYTLATILGLIIFSVVAGIIFIGIIAGMAASGSTSSTVKENSVFVLKLDGVIQERSEEGSPFDMVLNQNDMAAKRTTSKASTSRVAWSSLTLPPLPSRFATP